MCERGNFKEVTIGDKSISVDSCISDMVQLINDEGIFETLGCCCGHGKYKPTIVVRKKGTNSPIFEYYSGLKVTRTRNFYYKDDEGIFRLPELRDKIQTVSIPEMGVIE